MKLFQRALVFACAVMLSGVLGAQSYSTLYNNPTVESDTHWLVADTDTDVSLKLPGLPDKVYQVATAESNCVIVDQTPSVWWLYLTLRAPNAGACVFTLTVQDATTGDVLGIHEINLQSFNSAEEFPSVDSAMQPSAYQLDADEPVTMEGAITNATIQFPNNPIRPHLFWGDDNLPCESTAEVQSVQVDQQTGEFSITVIPNAFGFHSFKIPVQFDNGETGHLYMGFAAVFSPPAIHLFPSLVPLNEEIDMMVLSNFPFEQDDDIYVADGNGVISSVTTQTDVVKLKVTFTSLPAVVVVSRNDGAIQYQAQAANEWDDPLVPEFKECVKDKLDGKFKMNKQEGCLDLVGGIDLGTVRDALKPKLPDTAVIEMEVDGSDGNPIPVIVYVSQDTAEDGEDGVNSANGEDGTNGNVGGVGDQGDQGTDGQFPGGKGGLGQTGGQGKTGNEGETGSSGSSGGILGLTSAGKGGTPETWQIIVPKKDCPILVIVFGGDGGDGGKGGSGGNGGTGGDGGKGGKGGQGGKGGTGANGTQDAQGGFIGPGGDGGKGGAGGTGGIGGTAGKGGQGGGGENGGRGGDAQRVEIEVHDLVYLIAFEGNGGDGGKGGNGGNGGSPGVPGTGGEAGNPGDGGEPGDGSPAGQQGSGGDLGSAGPGGATSVNGSGGSAGGGGDGGENEGTIIVEGEPCHETIKSGSPGSKGSNGQTGSGS